MMCLVSYVKKEKKLNSFLNEERKAVYFFAGILNLKLSCVQVF